MLGEESNDVGVAKRPKILGAIAATLFVITYAIGLSDTWLGRLAIPLIGDPATSGIQGNLAAAAIVTLVLMLNFYLLLRLPRKAQIVLVWLELIFWLGIFFYSFDLSFAFI